MVEPVTPAHPAALDVVVAGVGEAVCVASGLGRLRAAGVDVVVTPDAATEPAAPVVGAAVVRDAAVVVGLGVSPGGWLVSTGAGLSLNARLP